MPAALVHAGRPENIRALRMDERWFTIICVQALDGGASAGCISAPATRKNARMLIFEPHGCSIAGHSVIQPAQLGDCIATAVHIGMLPILPAYSVQPRAVRSDHEQARFVPAAGANANARSQHSVGPRTQGGQQFALRGDIEFLWAGLRVRVPRRDKAPGSLRRQGLQRRWQPLPNPDARPRSPWMGECRGRRMRGSGRSPWMGEFRRRRMCRSGRSRGMGECCRRRMRRYARSPLIRQYSRRSYREYLQIVD